jgi:amino acid adenylation domain-containing protein
MFDLVQSFLEVNATRFPDKVALVCDRREFTYQELDNQANRLANALVEAGVSRGDRVALMFGNTLEMVVGIFAVLKAGAVFVPVHEGTRPPRLQQILESSRPVALMARHGLVGSEEMAVVLLGVESLQTLILARRDPGLASVGKVVLDWAEIQKNQSSARPPRQIIDLDLACLIYTSGSTGVPKGVMCDHGNMVFVSGSVVEYLGNNESDRILAVLSLAYSYGLYQLLATFRTGGTLILEASFAFPVLVLQEMAEKQVTGFAGTPTIFAILLQRDITRYDLSHLRYFTNAASGLPVEHVVRLRQKFPWVDFYSMHGLTEVARTVYLPPELVDQKPGSVGIAIPGTEAWIEDEEGRRVGPGVVGELIIRGRHVMRGYWENPEATAARFKPGPIPGERVCHTGDLFKTDADGHFYFVSRMDDIIKCRGEKVAPREVENVLCQIPGVIEAAVVGVPDPVFGQVVKAVLVTADGELSRETVLRHCRQHLEDHMLPRVIEFRNELPKTPSGKILRMQLT